MLRLHVCIKKFQKPQKNGGRKGLNLRPSHSTHKPSFARWYQVRSIGLRCRALRGGWKHCIYFSDGSMRDMLLLVLIIGWGGHFAGSIGVSWCKCWTCVNVLFLRYLFISIYCQTPSPLINLKSHLLRRHLLWSSKFRTPNPPCSFKVQITSHLVNLYFFLWSSLCQKKPWSEVIQLF
jgi:hypothetical protein